MHHDRFKPLLLAAACALACAWPSVHAATAAASVSGLTFTLVDLDPNDGIEPSITWAALSGDALTSASSGMEAVWLDVAQGLWTPRYTTVHPDGAASDTSTPFPTLGASSATAQASLTATGLFAAYAAPSNGGQGSATASLRVGFELSPMTQLQVSGRLAFSLQAPGGDQAAMPQGASTSTYLPFASAYAYLDVALDVLSGLTPGALSWTESETGSPVNHTVSTDPMGDTAAFSVSLDRSFAHTLSNDGTDAVNGSFRSLVTISGSQLATQAAVVPEPAGAGLAVAGALVGWVARRRRNAAAA
jgi:hypothetical protein